MSIGWPLRSCSHQPAAARGAARPRRTAAPACADLWCIPGMSRHPSVMWSHGIILAAATAAAAAAAAKEEGRNLLLHEEEDLSLSDDVTNLTMTNRKEWRRRMEEEPPNHTLPDGWSRTPLYGVSQDCNRCFEFDDYKFGLREGIEEISAGSNDQRPIQLSITYSMGEVENHGATNPPRHQAPFTIGSGSGITRVSLRVGRSGSSPGSPDCVQAIQFYSKDGRSSPVYGSSLGTTPVVIRAPKGTVLKAVFGAGRGDAPSSPRWLSLGFYFGPDIDHCINITNTSGTWTPIANTDASGTQIQYSYGTAHSYSATQTSSWSTAVTRSISAGFTFMGVGASVGVSSTTARGVTESSSTSFGTVSTSTTSYTAPRPGTIWQWRWNVSDNCGSSTSASHFNLVTTKGVFNPPCCLPGFAADPGNYSGACAAAQGDKIYDLCRA
jgi:nitrate reductase cytochrome c-type subunit